MLEFLDFLRTDSLDTLSVLLRLALAVVLGGVIGMERERRGRAAGFRTHILICLGAAMTTLTSQYIIFVLGYNADMSRMGAQVIAGVGFIGAGAVIVTQRKQIKGITTAAGIWTAAIVGLCCGAGFYEGAVLTALLVLFVEIIFSMIEDGLIQKRRSISVTVEYKSSDMIADIAGALNSTGSAIWGLEVRNYIGEDGRSSAVISVKLARKCSFDMLRDTLMSLEGVICVEKN